MAKKLKLAFLWHFHQPYYELNGQMRLPWVRLHGVKDYYDIPKIFNAYPEVKHTINLTPSLFEQLLQYGEGASDRLLELSKINADSVSPDEKEEIVNKFFGLNDKLILPYPHYSSLREKADRGEEFSAQDILDLQVWYNLAWLGNTQKKQEFASHLIKKGSGFTEEEKRLLLNYHIEILRQIPLQLKTGMAMGNLRYSFTPFYHPILPLLSTDEKKNYSEVSYPGSKSAKEQIKSGKKYIQDMLDMQCIGSWPSEGSLSDEVLDMYVDEGVRWVATDESVLLRSKTEGLEETSKFFPFEYSNNKGSINVFFRDTFLSDSIGFRYTGWDADTAAGDFIGHLESIRAAISDRHGEDALDRACINVILDGENCWEYYNNNGEDFLHSLLTGLSESDLIETVFHDDMAGSDAQALHSIYPGSWINASFAIWDGHPEDLTAWKYLSEAREIFEEKGGTNINAEHYLKVCEGSDWFWWFGPEHKAPERGEFDRLFRDNLREFYKELSLEAPEYLDKEIMSQERSGTEELPEVVPPGSFLLYKNDQAAMHRSGQGLESAYLSKDGLSLTLILSESLESGELNIVGHEFEVQSSPKKVMLKGVNEFDISDNILKVIFQKALERDFELKIGQTSKTILMKQKAL